MAFGATGAMPFSTGVDFTGQGRFVAKEVLRLHEPNVGGDHVAAFQHYYVPRCDLFRRNGLQLPFSPHARGTGAQLAQRLHGADRAQLGQKPDKRIDGEHEHDRSCLGPLTEKRGNCCGSGKQPHHGALELVGENGDGRPFCVRLERVRPQTLEPQCSFLLGEAVSAVHFLLPQHRLRRQRIGHTG